MTPFQVVYGQQPPPLIYYGDVVTTNATLDEQLKERDLVPSSSEGSLTIGTRSNEKVC